MAYHLQISRKNNHKYPGLTEEERRKIQRAGDLICWHLDSGSFTPGAKELAAVVAGRRAIIRVNDADPSTTIQAWIDERATAGDTYPMGRTFLRMTDFLSALTPPQRNDLNAGVLTLANSTKIENNLDLRV